MITNNCCRVAFFLLPWFILLGCTSSSNEPVTLADWDTLESGEKKAPVFIQPKSQLEIQQAYEEYLRSAEAGEQGRRAAMNRLARIELDKVQAMESTSKDADKILLVDEEQANALRKTIGLLRATLIDFPNAKDADVTLYQLAQSYERLGEVENSLQALRDLTSRFPQSIYFAEAQFRIGEYAFSAEDYFAAEVAYTDVVFAGEGHPLYEKSLIKRGWSRLKQNLYAEAGEDFVLAIKHRKFSHDRDLSINDKNDFDEYFRALTLAIRGIGDFSVLDNYFSGEDESTYIFRVYKVSALFDLRDKNYVAADALMEQFARSHPNSHRVADARLMQLDILRLSGATEKYALAMEDFYLGYGPQSPFWREQSKLKKNSILLDGLRNHILVLADTEQSRYRQYKSNTALASAQLWYQRYLEHFKNYARKDNVYVAYGELLALRHAYAQAIGLFEQAAYDDEIVLDKEAAYATIDLANKLIIQEGKPDPWLDKLLTYAQRGIRMYAAERRYQDAVIRALELAYQYQRYDALQQLSEGLPNTVPEGFFNQVNYLRALAYIKQGQPAEAEVLLMPLVNLPADGKRRNYRDALALSIYNQAKALQAQGDSRAAIKDFVRMAQAFPDVSITPDGLYDAITLAVKEEYWPEAGAAIELFQRSFPTHPLHKDATRQLSMVYLKLGKGDRAAVVFESIAKQDSDKSVKMAALWQAAELYVAQNKHEDAIRAYSNYAETYPNPYPQSIEAMHKLVGLYEHKRNVKMANSWRFKILTADRKAPGSQKNSRTQALAAQAALFLAEQEHAAFRRIALVEPLADNLRLKKKYMQSAIGFYGQAAAYQVSDVTLKSTFSIANIYQDFSVALLDSERPRNLSADELEQYNMLLEDQAFPFEEKAIEFYEINMARTAQGEESPWIQQSMTALRQLFPSRYARLPKLAVYKPQQEEN